MEAEELVAKLAARLAVYEREYSCGSGAGVAAHARDVIVSELEASIGYYWPHSAYSVLRAMWWTLAHPCPEGSWWREVDILLHVLNVGREPSAGAVNRWAQRYGTDSAANWRREINCLAAAWLAEVSTWPLDDRKLIYEWLAIANTWPFVKEAFAEEAKACLLFWSSAIAASSSGTDTDTKRGLRYT